MAEAVETWERRLRRWPAAEAQAVAVAGTRLPPFEVWRSADYLVQLFLAPEADGHVRITVNRVERTGSDWADGITWDELQRVKREIGLGDRWAVEIYPADGHLIDEANMRHLWLLPGPPSFAWGADRLA